MTVLALADTHSAWTVAVGLGAVVVVVVVVLMMLLLSLVKDIESSVGTLLDTAGKIAAQTGHLTQLGATAGVLDMIIDEALVQDGLMNVLRDAAGVAA